MTKNTLNTTATTASTLGALAAQINQAHQATELSLKAGVTHALQAGRLLIEAKSQVPSKGWLKWLKANCPMIPERTDQMYRKMAVDFEADPQRVAGLSLREAVRAFAKHLPKDPLWSSNSVEWYTMERPMKAVLKVLGEIDLDPCANPQKTVPAKKHFTKEDDGLSKAWKGKVFLNPPYGKTMEAWLDKLRKEYEQEWVTEAIALLPGHIDARWFHSLEHYDRCHLQGSLDFIRGEGPASKVGESVHSPHPSVVFYLGPDPAKFYRAFSKEGQVLRVIRSEEEAAVGCVSRKPVAVVREMPRAA